MIRYELAWQQALYGPDGFYRRTRPEQHFRTSVAAGDLLAQALAELARRAGLSRVVDVGAGGGGLLAALHTVDPSLALVGLDVTDRSEGLPPGARWLVSPGGAALPDDLAEHLPGALVVAHEWLDDVPCPVLRRGPDGWREVLVEPGTGREQLGGPPAGDVAGWLATWWPDGERAEAGTTRDRAWAGLVRSAVVAGGAADGAADGAGDAPADGAGSGPGTLLLAVDYAHRRGDRPPDGTLIGYRDGVAGVPVPDGAGDVTAHVALDSVAAAGTAAGAAPGLLVTQRTALSALGVSGRRPPASQAAADPLGYLAALERAGQAAELLDPAGLGGFGWLLQPVGPDPAGQVRSALATLAR